MNQEPASGSIIENTHILPIRIYYEDTDFSGVVYHAAYLKFMERGRTEALRGTGTDHRQLLELTPPVAFAVRHMDLQFIAPAKIDDALQVHTRFLLAKGARMRAIQQVVCRDQELILAKVELACIDLNGRPKRIPKSVLAKMSPFLYQETT